LKLSELTGVCPISRLTAFGGSITGLSGAVIPWFSSLELSSLDDVRSGRSAGLKPRAAAGAWSTDRAPGFGGGAAALGVV